MGGWGDDGVTSSGESLVAALAVMSEDGVIARGVSRMRESLETKMYFLE